MKVGRGETDHVFVDVDGTLLIWPTNPGAPRPGEVPTVNTRLVAMLKEAQRRGLKVVIWTMGGQAHAEMARRLCGLEGAICIPKPDIVIDDAPDFFKKKLPAVKPEFFGVGWTGGTKP